jgi:hypothetical protein
MTIQQTTPHLGLPLPHPDNDLETDVVRLRDALTQVDGAVFSLRSLVASDDVNLDTVQEVVTVLKQAQGSIGNVTALLATKADASAVAAQLAAKADASAMTTQLAAKADAAATSAALAGCASTGANTFTGAQSFSRPDKGTLASGTVTFNRAAGNVQRLQVGGALTLALSGFPAAGIFADMLIKLVNGGAYAVTLPTIQWVQPSGVPTATFATYLAAISRPALQIAGTDFIYLWTDDAGATIYGKLL